MFIFPYFTFIYVYNFSFKEHDDRHGRGLQAVQHGADADLRYAYPSLFQRSQRERRRLAHVPVIIEAAFYRSSFILLLIIFILNLNMDRIKSDRDYMLIECNI